jgi:amidohydrolase
MSDSINTVGALPEWADKQVVEWRRHLHRNPELSFQEHRTAAFVEQTLRQWPELEISRPTPTSVLAVLRGAHPGKVLALRADMDALPIVEENELPFSSQNPGVMHACGHDGHTAMLLAAAGILAGRKEELRGEIRFIFQHAEEFPPGGAIELVEAGVVDGVDWVFGIHLASLLPVGQIGVRAGEMMASPDNFTITIKGYGGHAAMPHRTIDVIAIGAQLIGHIQHIVSRLTDPLERLVVSVTQFTAGASHNVIPDSAVLKGTIRSFKPSVRAEAPATLKKMAETVAGLYGAEVEFDYVKGYDPVVNDEQLAGIVREAAVELAGGEAVIETPPAMGGEDFSAYQRKAPGVFVNVGAGNVEAGIVYPHHHPKFNFDERALGLGVRLFLRVANRLLQD